MISTLAIIQTWIWIAFIVFEITQFARETCGKKIKEKSKMHYHQLNYLEWLIPLSYISQFCVWQVCLFHGWMLWVRIDCPKDYINFILKHFLWPNLSQWLTQFDESCFDFMKNVHSMQIDDAWNVDIKYREVFHQQEMYLTTITVHSIDFSNRQKFLNIYLNWTLNLKSVPLIWIRWNYVKIYWFYRFIEPCTSDKKLNEGIHTVNR